MLCYHQVWDSLSLRVPRLLYCTYVDLTSLCDLILFLGLCGSKNVLEEV